MMWAVMGIGMLINTIKGAKMRSQANRQGAAIQQQMNQLRAEMGRTTESLKGGLDNFKPRFGGPDLSLHVEYPEKAYKNLNSMQQKHLGERQQTEGKLRQNFGQMKENFFKGNHYETQFGTQGKGRVLTDQRGKPLVKQGPESTQQKTVRQHFESSQRMALVDKHGKQMESLVKQESAKVKGFLGENAALLADAGVQQELQKMIVSSKKKALKLQQDQDGERWSVDMPPTPEIQEAVGVGLQEVRQMEARHVHAEEASPDHQTILDYEKDLATAMADERARAAVRKEENQFLMDPRKMMRRAQQGPPKKRFDEVLPGYLTANLFQMGIYQV